MTLAEIIRATNSAVNTVLSDQGGRCDIRPGRASAILSWLSSKPGVVCGAVIVTGENKRGEFEEASMVDQAFSVILWRPKSKSINSGDSIAGRDDDEGTVAEATPFLDIIESVRETVRGIAYTNDTTESTVDYLGFEELILEPIPPFDAYELKFTLGNLMPSPGD